MKLATSGDDGVVTMRRMTSPTVGDTLLAGEARVRSVSFSPDGRHLAASDTDGNLHHWDLAGRRPLGCGSRVGASS